MRAAAARLAVDRAMRTTSFSKPEYIPEAVREFASRRGAELGGILFLAGTASLAVALISWSVEDPSFNHATHGPIRNLLGSPGAIASDLTMQVLGIASMAALLPIAIWGWNLVRRREFGRASTKLLLWLAGTIAIAGLASAFPVPDRWPLPTGLGGVVGDIVLFLPRKLSGASRFLHVLTALLLFVTAILCLTAASAFPRSSRSGSEDEGIPAPASSRAAARKPAQAEQDDDEDNGEPGFGIVSVGAVVHGLLSLKASFQRLWLVKKASKPPRDRAPWLSSPGLSGQPGQQLDREYPQFKMPVPVAVERREPVLGTPPFDASEFAPRALRTEQATQLRKPASDFQDEVTEIPNRIAAAAPPIRPGKRLIRESQPLLIDRGAYELPPLQLLAEVKKLAANKISEDALEQNARLLEGVLDDFGVKGDIINVRPGPVVTLYELEPAPGIKSSRVIGLADDIARSMSAISARVAVVQGRNAIGVELPNQRRETVYLRELLASEDFEKSKHKLAIALGKTIGGEPVIVDLAKMPHLLVAGTTGSGKSVAINTMILSLLYRLKPEECRLIMVDPKMLELSVYDGIPHLLTPVVTDPKKAVVALKWAVREMEDRYKKMSKVGVRNIDGFNVRVMEAQQKGEVITRVVQTGYDKETGDAIYEQEDMDLAVLPYIVVIVDEMADLMMVAGKDIEGAIQRLAQMARAAGIHLIMATQRPSVDVITGTIKANFPTRISFQVTSRIDSRTILGEQGAEQLLGSGDMLYMAGGGRISRVHGPFVSDTEVEKIVAHLKTQGQPEYLDAITSEAEIPDEAATEAPAQSTMDGEESADLYDRAVNIVLRDRKCSTSYIQRRLSVGYNKAASLVERMEREGVVGSPNHSGKREILTGGGVDRGAFDPGQDE